MKGGKGGGKGGEGGEEITTTTKPKKWGERKESLDCGICFFFLFSLSLVLLPLLLSTGFRQVPATQSRRGRETATAEQRK
jgi:hypothetical protein